MNEELQQKIDELSRVVKTQDEKIVALENKPIQLDRLLDNSSKDVIEDIISERFISIFWDDFFYYNTHFEGDTGFNILNNVTLSGGGCAVTSPGTGVASSSIYGENDAFVGGFSFKKESRFRATVNFTRTTNQDIRIGIGSLAGVGAHGYGFRISGSTLQGFAQTDSTSRTTLTLKTITASVFYNLDAIFYPGGRVDFIVDGVQLGSIESNLPTTISTKLWEVEATESNAETKQIFFGSFEYIQRRN